MNNITPVHFEQPTMFRYNMIKIDKSLVEQVKWEQDPDTFDQRLCALGSAYSEFIIVNPRYEWILDYIDVDTIDSDKCVMWSIDDLWLIKKFKSNWTVDQGWKFINCKFELERPEVVFISYNEPNAEANWHRLLDVVPNAKRVKNVKGIFEAHKRAAEIATTEMFFVVDGDAELVHSWTFNFRPTVVDMGYVHVWSSLNPVNDLEYGYGGVKLFPRNMLLDATTWEVDLTMGLGDMKFHNEVSNITSFNTDPYGTWRSAFRECAKLSSSLAIEYNIETEHRLNAWTTLGLDRQYGKYALHAAALGKQYGIDNFDNSEALKLINNYEWMKNEFDKFYKQ